MAVSCYLEESKIGHILATARPITTKFDMVTDTYWTSYANRTGR